MMWASSSGLPLYLTCGVDAYRDRITGRVRAVLQARFGDAGRGVLPPGPLYEGYAPYQVEMTAVGWRLVLAPPDVRRWVVAHEVAHRVHMNHGPAFKALESELFEGDADGARLLLRRVGPGLRRIGRRF